MTLFVLALYHPLRYGIRLTYLKIPNMSPGLAKAFRNFGRASILCTFHIIDEKLDFLMYSSDIRKHVPDFAI